ncbi:MAG: hypothetical protein E7647_06535 [Ruminococcaceae bacterium]|nr:hypothetical protein [Oscillospiraceae bacterium]
MSENRLCQSPGRETVCIDTYRILDSCRDKDCFEDVRVFLTGYGQELIERGSAVRAKCARIVWSYIDIDPVPFNRGFYQLNIKIYVRIIAEVCVSPGNIQEIEGIAVVEKKVILFGSEGNVSVFKSEAGNGCSGFCPSGDHSSCSRSSNLPIAVLETVDPIILGSKVVCAHERIRCCCHCEDIPESVCCTVNGGSICDSEGDRLVVTLGLFSVVRIERPAQYLINAAEYCVPEKECVEAQENDPCSLFRSMAFPVSEFCPPSLGGRECDPPRCTCK